MIWVLIVGGILGFKPEEIRAFEESLHTLPEDTDYWAYFNWYFAEDLGTNTAIAYWQK